MTATRWVVDGAEGPIVEHEGHRFSGNDDGAPMMCSLVCQGFGRHAHVDYCRTTSGACVISTSGDGQHSSTHMQPNLAHPKDWITHNLHWRRMGNAEGYHILSIESDRSCSTGFKGKDSSRSSDQLNDPFFFLPDPYSREDQANFAKW
jgi:hypothetical protein